jgi:hypothetical protein
MQTTEAPIRGLRTVALFATGAATYRHRSAFAQLSGWPRLLRAGLPKCARQPRPALLPPSSHVAQPSNAIAPRGGCGAACQSTDVAGRPPDAD